MSTAKPLTEPRIDATPVGKRNGGTLAFILGLFGIGTGFITLLADMASFISGFLLLGFLFFSDSGSFPVVGFAVAYIVILLLLFCATACFSASLGLSTSSMLVNISNGICKEKRNKANPIVVTILIIVGISFISRCVFSVIFALLCCTSFIPAVLVFPVISLFAAIVSLGCAILMSLCGLIASWTNRKGRLNHIFSSIGLLLVPVVTKTAARLLMFINGLILSLIMAGSMLYLFMIFTGTAVPL